MAITQERLEQIANEVVIHALENIGLAAVGDYIDEYTDDRITEDEFDEIYETVQAIADDTAQRILDRDS